MNKKADMGLKEIVGILLLLALLIFFIVMSVSTDGWMKNLVRAIFGFG